MITSEVFACFVFYGTLLVIKMYVVAIITGQVRLRKKVRACAPGERWKRLCCNLKKYSTFFCPIKAFANPEDALRHGGLQYHRKDPYVERCRR